MLKTNSQICETMLKRNDARISQRNNKSDATTYKWLNTVK